jgi:hypothetical protein
MCISTGIIKKNQPDCNNKLMTIMKESYIETEYFELWIENGIIHGIYRPTLKVITLDIAKQMVTTRLKLSNGLTRPIFVDICNVVSIDKASRICLAEGDAMKCLSATAILVKNQITKLAASIYIRIDKPAIPTKFFTDKRAALLWLEQYKYLN